MSKEKLSPSRLRHARTILESGEPLTEHQRNMLLQVIDNQLEDRELENSLSEFHKWIRLGEPILTAVEAELKQLRAITAEDGDTISKAAVFDILDKLRNRKPKNDVDAGVNWVLDRVSEEINILYSA